jgi:hypothetical protein
MLKTTLLLRMSLLLLVFLLLLAFLPLLHGVPAIAGFPTFTSVYPVAGLRGLTDVPDVVGFPVVFIPAVAGIVSLR